MEALHGHHEYPVSTPLLPGGDAGNWAGLSQVCPPSSVFVFRAREVDNTSAPAPVASGRTLPPFHVTRREGWHSRVALPWLRSTPHTRLAHTQPACVSPRKQLTAWAPGGNPHCPHATVQASAAPRLSLSHQVSHFAPFPPRSSIPNAHKCHQPCRPRHRPPGRLAHSAGCNSLSPLLT